MDRILTVALAGLLLLAACSQGAGPDAPATAEDAPQVPWVVAAAHPLATDAGAEILARGGSAVDAAVAVQAVLGLVEPQSSGLGGGAFLIHYDAETGTTTAYDGRETAPASAHPDIFLNEDGSPMGYFEAVTSGLAVGVPGAVAMLDMAHGDHGILPWEELFAEAERLARDGFAMPVRLNTYLRRMSLFREDPGAAIYLLPDGSVIPVGEIVRNPDYAATVAAIAETGADAFYLGPIADAIIARVNAQTGEQTLTRRDFELYAPVRREPVCGVIRAHRVCSMPPPSSGGVTLLQIMALFEKTAGAAAPEDALFEYIEASRLAYADRDRYLADPSAMGTQDLAANELVAALLDDGYLAQRARAITDGPAAVVEPGAPAGIPVREGRIDDRSYEVPATSHFSIRDSRGNIVSMTTTVEAPFGSQMMAAGMVLNNQLTDFSRVPRIDGRLSVNAPDAQKRPRSSMTPVIVFGPDGTPRAAIGSPGGPAIIGYVAKPLIDHLMTGQPLGEAIREPHVVVPRGSVIVEEGGTALAAEARTIGYDVTESALTSGLYGFVLGTDGIDPVVDPRREGSARISDDGE